MVLPLYIGSKTAGVALLKSDLRERGVWASVLKADGDCRVVRNRLSGKRRQQGCDLEIAYEVQPQHGGGVRSARVWKEGQEPVIAVSAKYDPQDPSRVMLASEVDRPVGTTNVLIPLSLLLLPLGIALAWFFGEHRRFLKYLIASESDQRH
jgi:hypothetical protein